jgi:uncharacterized protein YbcV (DUF1398 family)
MFTTEQLTTAHGKVKSGADFPAYIQEIKNLGVKQYETYVIDGHTDFHGADGHTVTVAAKYPPLTIANVSKVEDFKTELRIHQQGKTDYPTFIRSCAETGIEKWKISIDHMTCTYFDKAGNEILVEQIPQ